MVAAPVSRLITPEEFLRMPESEGAELIDGVIVERCMGAQSGLIASEVEAALRHVILP